jgi:hypothetical protein
VKEVFMPLAPDRVDYSPIIDRPVIRWPNGARVAFWVAPNIEHYEYLPLLDGSRKSMAAHAAARRAAVFAARVLPRDLPAEPRIRILHRTEVEEFTQRREGVAATVRQLDDGERFSIECAYLVGCDGAGSMVRKAIGAAFVGTPALQQVQSTYLCAPGLLGMLLHAASPGPSGAGRWLRRGRGEARCSARCSRREGARGAGPLPAQNSCWCGRISMSPGAGTGSRAPRSSSSISSAWPGPTVSDTVVVGLIEHRTCREKCKAAALSRVGD